MQAQFVANLYSTISRQRLAPYNKSPDAHSQLDVLALYMYNAALSEALYPALQNLEVGLRNRMSTALASELGSERWMIDHIDKFRNNDDDGGEQKVIKSVCLKLAKEKKPMQAGTIIAALHFGFWHALTHPDYEKAGILWPGSIEYIFPSMPSKIRTRKFVRDRLDMLRVLRNRVFHHEPIWNLNVDGVDLDAHHKKLLDAIGWIDPELWRFTVIADRYKGVVAAGYQAHYDKIKDFLDKAALAAKAQSK
ncbi:MAG TPA: Abi family protein [Chloroflexia bacterium]|nr:Abi family protein [Chloroflexia bacterium]